MNMAVAYWNSCRTQAVLDSLVNSNLYCANNDFNGVNGEEFTSQEALDAGFTSDMDYTVDKIIQQDYDQHLSIAEVVTLFVDALFEGGECVDYEIEILQHPKYGCVGCAVAWCYV